MALQRQHGSGDALTVVQQHSPESRSWSHSERDVQPVTILSLEQIRISRGRNEYTEGPSVAKRASPRRVSRPEKQERAHEILPINVNNNSEYHAGSSQTVLGQMQHSTLPAVLSRSTSTGSSGSNSSASSEQGLLGRCHPSKPGQVVRLQPRATNGDLQKVCGKEAEPQEEQHRLICERCGKCKCSDCTAPRALPSCLACDRQCLCSAESMVEYSTCMCLVKGLFYHCSNDDEGDSSADSPCSCSQAHCCSRYLCMGALALFLPCLLCYPPAKGCLRLCRSCYDHMHRPGCRCKNSNTVYCKLESGLLDPRGRGKPS